MYVLCFEIGICEEAGADGSEACVWSGKKDTGNINDVTRIELTCETAVTVDGKCSRDVADWNL